jgi:hypothetical protein
MKHSPEITQALKEARRATHLLTHGASKFAVKHDRPADDKEQLRRRLLKEYEVVKCAACGNGVAIPKSNGWSLCPLCEKEL